ncbi:MSHA biogenesis protein MshI [Alteromonas oceanisediminis]|uniref:MSHA biogenesis protein MshI n=1 Tax=Alteromonas oceanisediminis TaxID=2836180 RepID=UPI001BD9C0AB|nr:MSHA biogenesis protein MshI [Alteromonas oceanisediminis]MBT0586864.1 MSHA biogenesis protein MshI [Alteromonas oceanisediminis]
MSQPKVALYHEVPVGSWRKALEKWVDKHKVGAAPCAVAFSGQLTRTYQVEKPKVDSAEMHQALKWPVKELIGADSDSTVFDYYDPPAQPSGVNNINIVAVNQEDVDATIAAVLEAGLKLDAITVEDMAICELTPSTDEPVMTLVQRAGDEIQLNIIKGGALYFSRTLKGFENLGSFSVEELQMGVLDSLSVQLQRSMDYFESQLRQAPLRKILMGIEASNSAAIAEQISALMQVDVEPFELGIEVADSIDSSKVFLSAVGTALSVIQDSSARVAS